MPWRATSTSSTPWGLAWHRRGEPHPSAAGQEARWRPRRCARLFRARCLALLLPHTDWASWLLSQGSRCFDLRGHGPPVWRSLLFVSILHYLQSNNLSLDFIKLGFLKSERARVLRQIFNLSLRPSPFLWATAMRPGPGALTERAGGPFLLLFSQPRPHARWSAACSHPSLLCRLSRTPCAAGHSETAVRACSSEVRLPLPGRRVRLYPTLGSSEKRALGVRKTCV